MWSERGRRDSAKALAAGCLGSITIISISLLRSADTTTPYQKRGSVREVVDEYSPCHRDNSLLMSTVWIGFLWSLSLVRRASALCWWPDVRDRRRR